MTGGLSSRNGRTWARRGRGSAAARRDDVGDRRLAEQDRDLAEEVAARQRRPLLAVDDDVGLAVEDDVERRARTGPGAGPARPPAYDAAPRTCARRARAAASARSANSAKPAIWSTISSRLAIARGSSDGADLRPRILPPCPATRPGRRLTTAPVRPQHQRSSSRRISLTLTQDRRTELLGACRLFSGVAPADLAAVGGSGDRGRLPGRPRDRPAGRDRDRLLPRRRRCRPGRPRRRGARGPRPRRVLRRAVGPRRAAARRPGRRDRADALPRPRVVGLRAGASSTTRRSPWRSSAGLATRLRPSRSSSITDEGSASARALEADRDRHLPVHRHRGLDEARPGASGASAGTTSWPAIAS